MKLKSKITTLSLALALIGSTVFVTSCKKDKKTEEPVCNAPVITASPQATVTTETYDFTANITEIDNQSLVNITVNGASIPFTYNPSTDVLTAAINFTTGTNNISITANGCEVKSASYSVFSKNATAKITGKNFKMTAFTVNPGFPVIGTDIYSQVQPCTKDDLLTFNTNNTVTFDEGPSKCDPNDPQTTSGTWVWNTDETILTITETGSSPTSYTIVTNDGTTLKVTFTEVDNGITYTYTITWVKQ